LIGGAFGLLGFFGFIPKPVHFGQACLLRSLAAGCECALYRRETPLKFHIGLPQHRFRICIKVAREINHGKQQIADFGSSRGFVSF